MTGAPLGRTVAERIVQLGEEIRRVDRDTGGKCDVWVFVFLQK